MAIATVTEFDEMGDARDGKPQIVQWNPNTVAQTAISYTTATQSAAFGTRTTMIRLATKSGCHYAVGANPTADGNDPWLGADGVEYIGVSAGHKISVYDGTS